MRLRQIRLAGFKSFVDPTPIDVPGRRVGVVGPNGCGKSNVMDAVRWVLGESKAAELRGESMQDVIFNGAANRKPAGRASVELVFDNSEGRISGEWGKYAEISVKRVLTRDGASSYLINNQQVRRRDVQDIFLGTGLGPRAYAIIGQGMISRIIEARPEELRVFLEEAAGISKYKERRRETENRLADTRDNLTRLHDIQRELDTQIEKLQQQAEIARRYQELKQRQDGQQQLLWLTRKREADAERLRAQREIGERATALDGRIADLRSIERELETLRAAHIDGGDAVHAAQGEVMRVSAEIGRMEAEVRMIGDSRARVSAQIENMGLSRARRELEVETSQRRANELLDAIEALTGRHAAATEASEVHEAAVPAMEAAYVQGRELLASARAAASSVEQAIAGAGLEQRTLQRQVQGIVQRKERLAEERRQLGAPDDRKLLALREDMAAVHETVEHTQLNLAEAEALTERLQAQRQTQIDGRAVEAEALSRLEARLSALREVQARVQADDQLDPWLRLQGLDRLPRLFKSLQVAAGWEAAFEAVLRERIEAIETSQLDQIGSLLADAPPARVAFYATTGAIARIDQATQRAGWTPLLRHVQGHDAALVGVLSDWLADVYAIDDLDSALKLREQLPNGGQFVVPGGHIVSRHALRFYAADDRKAGLLSRRQEIENLDRQGRASRLSVEQCVADLSRTEVALRAAQLRVSESRAAVERDRETLHAMQLESVRMAELIERVRQRSAQIDLDAAEIGAEEETLFAQLADVEARFELLDQTLGGRQEAVELARNAYDQADAKLREARDRARGLDGERHRLEVELRAQRERHGDVTEAMNVATADVQGLIKDIEHAALELAKLDDSAAREGLQQWLQARAEAEQRLREMRSRYEELTANLRLLDERRLDIERDLEPRRQSITEWQLKEQAARLAVEQFSQQLSDAGGDAAALEAVDTSTLRTANLQGEITRLSGVIEALGAVNLAAVQELDTSSARKSFLDSQCADLLAAIDTLEDAIRKIDRETRELLQITFDQVNFHFGQLFPTLFGGGEAKLVMTGEEILDAGVQVMAQPPGKRNSSIYLLSGGEKALTATALVFAMFKLNPAPFCLLDEVDAPLDDANTERFCNLVRTMSDSTQFLFITHNKIAMELAEQLVGVTMQEQGVSRIVAVDIDSAMRLTAEAA